MKAILCPTYRDLDNLKIGETGKPTCKDTEVLIEVHASSVNFNNLAFVIGKPAMARLWTGMFRPKYLIPGDDVSGTVVETGSNVTKFKAGDDVFGEISVQWKGSYGAFAEFVCAPENAIIPKPSNVSFYEAAAVPEAATALSIIQSIAGTGGFDTPLSVFPNAQPPGLGWSLVPQTGR